jgi:hypothetical protein
VVNSSGSPLRVSSAQAGSTLGPALDRRPQHARVGVGERQQPELERGDTPKLPPPKRTDLPLQERSLKG